MLNPANSKDIPILVCVFGWIKEATLTEIKKRITGEQQEQSFLLISWIGNTQDEAAEVEGWIFSERKQLCCKAQANMDDAKYWFINPKDSGWTSC